MNTLEPFSSSLDWGNAFVDSLIWIVRAWAIAAFCTVSVLALIARFTTWGQQFWNVTGAHFTGPHSVKVWAWLGGILLSVITGVRLSVLFSYQVNDLNSAVQVAVQGAAAGDESVKASGINGFWISLLIFCVIAAVLVARVLIDLFITQRFMLAWRAWLTDRLTGDWLDGRAYYRDQFIDDTIDNPDQRIQTDIDVFTAISGPQPNTPHQTSNGTLLFGAISSIVSVISFTAILWNLSGGQSLFAFEVTGKSGAGKTTLLRSLAQLWLFTSGTMRGPAGENETMFLSQLPYVPLGDLRAVVSYPRQAGQISDETLCAALELVALPHCADRLCEVDDWAKVLSPGEQQRVAFARILLTKPKAVFLDEATSALDEPLEFMIYGLVRRELPETVFVSVTHRTTVNRPRATPRTARRGAVAVRPGRKRLCHYVISQRGYSAEPTTG